VVFSSIEIMKFPHNFVAIAKILDAAGENWTISKQAREVVNFGFYAAEGKLTKQFMDRVVEGAKALGVKRLIVTECGHAYDALRFHAANIYGEQLPFEVTHITAVIGELLQAGRIKLKKGAFDNGKTITFHDACKIQRRGGMMKEPRMVMKQIAPESFKEMVPNNEDAWCCGGGGGVISIDAATPVRMAAFGIKVDQMRDVKADTVVMSCSNCRLQFLDGVKHFNLDVEVTGLAQMVADALEG
ncbi:MAG: (Fe-S)-binding protein, partial [Chloroflexi bacterium]|nr:(Fe-S)-binding protein [Chloroflexota bacterium]